MLRIVALLGVGLLTLSVSHADISDKLNSDTRTESDRARDQRDRPELVISLLDIDKGDHVADIFAGGGYYSELIASVVGEKGTVYLHNNAAYRKFAAPGLDERFKKNHPKSLLIHDAETDDLKLPANELTAALMVMSYHDLYFVDDESGWTAIDAADFLDQIHTALKPGGRLVIVDHAAAPNTGKTHAQDLHRIDPAFAIKDLQANGFELIASSPVLANAADNHSISVFDPSIRGQTDRFIHVYAKTK